MMVEFVVLVLHVPPSASAPEEVERIKIKGKEAKPTSTRPSFSIQVERLERVTNVAAQSADYRTQHQRIDFKPASYAASPAWPQGRGYLAGDGVCCVSCDDGFTACANCAVSIQGCGFCTTGDCRDGNPLEFLIRRINRAAWKPK